MEERTAYSSSPHSAVRPERSDLLRGTSETDNRQDHGQLLVETLGADNPASRRSHNPFVGQPSSVRSVTTKPPFTPSTRPSAPFDSSGASFNDVYQIRPESESSTPQPPSIPPPLGLPVETQPQPRSVRRPTSIHTRTSSRGSNFTPPFAPNRTTSLPSVRSKKAAQRLADEADPRLNRPPVNPLSNDIRPDVFVPDRKASISYSEEDADYGFENADVDYSDTAVLTLAALNEERAKDGMDTLDLPNTNYHTHDMKKPDPEAGRGSSQLQRLSSLNATKPLLAFGDLVRTASSRVVNISGTRLWKENAGETPPPVITPPVRTTSRRQAHVADYFPMTSQLTDDTTVQGSVNPQSEILDTSSYPLSSFGNVSSDSARKSEAYPADSKHVSAPQRVDSLLNREDPTPYDDDDDAIEQHQPYIRQKEHFGRDELPIGGQFYAWQGESALRGKSLGIFSNRSWIRHELSRLFAWKYTEVIIMMIILLHAALLIADAWDGLEQRNVYWGTWKDYILLGIFSSYTIELVCRVIVNGLLFDSGEARSRLLIPNIDPTILHSHSPDRSSAAKDFTLARTITVRPQTRPTAYLRHSWNRIDMISVVSYWIDLALMLTIPEYYSAHHIYWFSALSSLRLMRLLNVTSGSATILQSLKKSAPMLVNVAFFVGFFFVLFAIIGIQAFKGSFLRRCIWTNPEDSSDVQVLNRYCGGHYLENGTSSPFIYFSGAYAPWSKGFICPYPQKCQACLREYQNAWNGTVSFDNIAESMMLVFVIAGVQNWTDLMYDMMDAENVLSCIYFIIIVVVMNFWMVNLFVAVITELFAKIREDTKHSAFTSSRRTPVLADTDEGWMINDPKLKHRGRYRFGELYAKYSRIPWVVVVFADLAVMGMKTYGMSDATLAYLKDLETGFTFIFAVEIILRFASYFPPWRSFFFAKMNQVDLALAVATCIIQLPGIRDSAAYPWLTGFQVLRAYRIIVALPRMRKLMARILGSVIGLVNLIFFIILITLLCSIIAVQVLRGIVDQSVAAASGTEMTFYTVYNSFAALNQLFSGENWPNVLYSIMAWDIKWLSSAIDALFLCFWFAFSNFVLLNMFIAIIMENFETQEEEKQRRQLEHYVSQNDISRAENKAVISRWNIFRYLRPQPANLSISSIPHNLVLPTQKHMLQEFLFDKGTPGDKVGFITTHSCFAKGEKEGPVVLGTSAINVTDAGDAPGEVRILWNYFRHSVKHFVERQTRGFRPSKTQRHSLLGDIALHDVDRKRQSTYAKESPEQTDYIDSVLQESFAMIRLQEVLRENLTERREQEKEFLMAHPMYDKSLWVFSSSNPIRRACQFLVPPSHGERILGRPPSEFWSSMFLLLIVLGVIANIAVTATNSPQRQLQELLNAGSVNTALFNALDVMFVIFFTVECIIRVIADGFLFTPNAYLLNPWNGLDFFVLLTMYLAAIGQLYPELGLSRSFRAFKALRALRLINVLSSVKDTFSAILVSGLPRILDAAALSLCLIIPFALYGQNVFQGLFYYCTDNNAAGISDCVGETWLATTVPMANNVNLYMPRTWVNPYVYSFDSFWKALLILFEIVSGEGWINVEQSAMSIVGMGQNNQQDASQLNGIFFMVYNVAGSVFVLNLFLGIVIENFTKRNGSAYLTVEQRQWLDLKKLLKQIRPARRPKKMPTNIIRKWCFQRCVDKRGWFSKLITATIVCNIILLCSETYSEGVLENSVKEFLFLACIVVYMLEIVVKFIGLGFRTFRQNRWNWYDLTVVLGGAVTTLSMLQTEISQSVVEAQKLFLTAICFKLVQKSDSLNQLFKTMAASAPQIANLFVVWFVVMVTYAIMFVEIFGLTKYGTQATNEHVNFRDFGYALLGLIRFSTGESWNTVMHDYTVETPNCVDNANYLLSDCGSAVWAYSLFLSFNVISMYIFTSMFIVVVLDNFSYVYQIGASFSLVTRDEIRNFKTAWAEIDTERTGSMDDKDFVRFFRKLTGIFDVKVHDQMFSITSLKADVLRTPSAHAFGEKYPVDIDVELLNAKLALMNRAAVHKNRKTLDTLYWLAKSTATPVMVNGRLVRRITFSDMLLLLAQVKLINPEHSLLIDELIEYRRKMEGVKMLIHFDVVKGMLETIATRRSYLQRLQKRRGSVDQSGAVPEIFVDSSPTNPHLSINIHRANALSVPSAASSPGFATSPNNEGSYLEYFGARHRRSSYNSRSSVEYSPRLSASPRNDQDVDQEDVYSNVEDLQDADQMLMELQSGSWHDLLREAGKR